jgi:hypothetical protein
VRKEFFACVVTMLIGTGLGLAQGPEVEGAAPPGPASDMGSIEPSQSGIVGLHPAPGERPAMPPTFPEFMEDDDAPNLRMWASADYLLWWVRSGSSPVPLVTTGTTTGLGILGQPGTSTVAGGTGFDYGPFSGGRLTLDFWLDPHYLIGIEGGGFVLQQRNDSMFIASDATGAPVLSRPVINAQTGAEAIAAVSLPGAFSGFVNVSSGSQLWGAETNLVAGIYRSEHLAADLLLGFRYAALNEDLNIANSTTSTSATGLNGFNGALVGPPNSVAIFDRFQTRNEFYGGQIGLRSEFHYNRFFADFRTDLAVGNAYELVNIGGVTTLVGTSGTSATVPGGLLAVSSNSGRSSQNHFTFLPDAQIKLGCQLTCHVMVYVGYDFMYWYDVLRPGDQIDRTVNPGLVPSNVSFGTVTGPIRPVVPLERTDFWAQGVTFGLEVRF